MTNKFRVGDIVNFTPDTEWIEPPNPLTGLIVDEISWDSEIPIYHLYDTDTEEYLDCHEHEITLAEDI